MTPSSPSHRRPGCSDRGQTGIDFVFGVGVFLLSIAFVFSFVPGMLAPFGDAAGATIVADRIGDELVYDDLAGTAGPSVLDEQCTLAFFGHSSPADCPFEDSGDPEEWLAIPAGTHLNVTIEKNLDGAAGREVACWESGRLTDCDSGGDRLAYGEPTPAMGASVATASRVVYMGDTEAVLMVRVW